MQFYVTYYLNIKKVAQIITSQKILINSVNIFRKVIQNTVQQAENWIRL